jgi:hypothetical protein
MIITDGDCYISGKNPRLAMTQTKIIYETTHISEKTLIERKFRNKQIKK